jgi:diacylglycerol kinase family enzyme
MKTYILFNPSAGNSDATKAEILKQKNDGICINVHDLESYADFFAGIDPADKVILLGGDGTLMRFANEVDGIDIPNDVFYMPYGTGNDFFKDVSDIEGVPYDLGENAHPIRVNDYIKNLPEVTIDGKSYKFINGVGFGIDGYCCEMGDKLKAESDKPVNYTAIAIKGLLFDYKPCGATVTVDGVVHRYEKVWIAPTMHGRYYGGGMNAAPEQDRTAEDGKLTAMLFHDSGKIATLMVFPKIFKGEHVKSKKVVALHTGYDITVEFDEPRPLQIDGETFVGVKAYRAVSRKKVKV